MTDTPEQLSLRATVVGLVTPVIISLVAMAFWSESYGRPGEMVVSTERFTRSLAIEVLLAATLGGWLWRQGWRPHRTATQPFEWRDLWRALGVWLAALMAAGIWALLCRSVAPQWVDQAERVQRVGHLSLGIIVPLSVFNAVFEELVWLGLGVAALERYGVRLAAGISIGLRTLVHVYQGPLALIGILPLGVVFTVYYVRSRRLWPVVVAHACQDVMALALIASGLVPQGAR
jgi:membrane protease YdiL (CAAX protease family)